MKLKKLLFVVILLAVMLWAGVWGYRDIQLSDFDCGYLFETLWERMIHYGGDSSSRILIPTDFDLSLHSPLGLTFHKDNRTVHTAASVMEVVEHLATTCSEEYSVTSNEAGIQVAKKGHENDPGINWTPPFQIRLNWKPWLIVLLALGIIWFMIRPRRQSTYA